MCVIISPSSLFFLFVGHFFVCSSSQFRFMCGYECVMMMMCVCVCLDVYCVCGDCVVVDDDVGVIVDVVVVVDV